MLPSFVSFAALWGGYLRRRFTSAGLTSQSVAVDDETTVHFWGPKIQNPQKPSLFLIHGFGPIAVWQWGRQVQFFAPHFNVFVPDLVFFGGSTTTSAERSEQFQAAAVAKLVEKIGVKRFHVVGTSYGGFVAYHLAEMLGEERVEKVVIASSGVNWTKGDHAALLERAQLEKIEDLMLPVTPQNLRKLLNLAVSRRLHILPDFFLKDLLKQLYSENRKEKIELLKGVSVGKEDTPNLSTLQQEVLIVWGENDGLFPVQMAHELKEVISKKARLELIKDASHAPQTEKAGEFNHIILNFLRASS